MGQRHQDSLKSVIFAKIVEIEKKQEMRTSDQRFLETQNFNSTLRPD